MRLISETQVPAGQLASVVISLQMLARPPDRPAISGAGCDLRGVRHIDLDRYRALYRRIGTDLLWSWRLAMSSDELAGIVHDQNIEVHVLQVDGRDDGLVELDFRQAGECELKLFGVAADQIGTGAGRMLMQHAIARAWTRPIRRFWVHTCSMDHPRALPFYMRSGFVPYARRIEIEPDPRATGLLPLTAAPHIPFIA